MGRRPPHLRRCPPLGMRYLQNVFSFVNQAHNTPLFRWPVSFAVASIFVLQAFGQIQAPLYETRAVWLATVLQDGNWPLTGAPADQQEDALRNIIREAHALGVNTFYFQAVARGDAMYRSERLPWSALLKGAGEDPGFDPLAVAIDEAHRVGMELHAWMNVFRIGDTGTAAAFENVTDPQHVYYAEPGWIAEIGSQIWMDPYVAEGRDWLVGNALEIVENYDIDGIHFDFLRYPQGGIVSDDANFQFDDQGFDNIPDWRRANVNAFAEAAFEAILPVKPWVKIGAAPLGNYRETEAWRAFWAYSDAYQESRLWVQSGWFDYLSPQIYFSTGTAPEGSNTFASPDFTVLVDEWIAESGGRPIVAGMGVYKPAENRFPAEDLVKQIEVSREAGAAGHAAFRFDHLKQFAGLITSTYEHDALPTPMTHRFEAAAPSMPLDLVASDESAGQVTLSWLASAGTTDDPLRSYVVFRRSGMPPSTTDPGDLLAVIDGSTTSFVDESVDAGSTYFYRIAARSALGVLSPLSEPVATDVATTTGRPGPSVPRTTIVSLFPNPATQNARLVYHIAASGQAELLMYDTVGRRTSRLFTGFIQPGTHALDIDTRHLANGVYQVVLRTPSTTDSWPLMINR